MKSFFNAILLVLVALAYSVQFALRSLWAIVSFWYKPNKQRASDQTKKRVP